MPLVDTSYIDASLDAVVAAWPASGANYHLYASDPTLATTPSDVELGSLGGYAPVAFSPSAWAAAAGGSKSTTAAVSFGTSTDAYTDDALYWAIVDGSGVIVFYDFLDDPIVVDVAGTAVSFTPTLSFADAS